MHTRNGKSSGKVSVRLMSRTCVAIALKTHFLFCFVLGVSLGSGGSAVAAVLTVDIAIDES